MKLFKYENETLLGLLDGSIDLKEIVANTVDASVEKHKPIYEIHDETITVTVGEVVHPSTEEHHIDYIILETRKGYQIKKLDHTKEPIAKFSLIEDKALNIYAYCNLHGLWKTEII